jgi:DeoR/GlpR family transcriptional regulator of sugar metabolism
LFFCSPKGNATVGTHLNAERQQLILALINERGRATVEQLSEHFGVSEATIRRDLEKLTDLGTVRRARGGALALPAADPEPPIVRRAGDHAEAKQRIGRAAAELVRDGETIFLGSGTTTQEVARHLGGRRGLKVITNALNVANVLAASPEVSTIIVGGLLRNSELSMVGYLAEQALQELRADKVIMGIRALSVEHGLTNELGPETSTDRAIVRAAPELIVVADHSKLGRVANVNVAPISAVHTLVTSEQAPPEIVEELRRLGLRVDCV